MSQATAEEEGTSQPESAFALDRNPQGYWPGRSAGWRIAFVRGACLRVKRRRIRHHIHHVGPMIMQHQQRLRNESAMGIVGADGFGPCSIENSLGVLWGCARHGAGDAMASSQDLDAIDCPPALYRRCSLANTSRLDPARVRVATTLA